MAKYDWWGYVKSMIRKYPERKSSPPLDSTTAGREYIAVCNAIYSVERYDNGRERLAIIDLVFWKHSHTLEGAALQVPCSYRTAQRYHEQFIKSVAKEFGLLDF